jgi:Retrotransposon gag protein
MSENTSDIGNKTQESGEAVNTAALLEKLTQLITLQQNQIMSLSQIDTHKPATTVVEAPIQPNPISIKLDDTNYTLWSQAMRMYVKGRDKMRHITGNPSPPLPSDPLFQRRDIDDSIVKGWLINSLDPKLQNTFIQYPTAKEVWDAVAITFYDGNDKAQVYNLNKRVTRLKQSGRSVEEYYHELQGLWREIDYRRPNPMIHAEDITKFTEFVQETRVYTFLDGLDDRLDNVRAVVPQMASFPSVEQAYAIVRRETSRQGAMLKGEEGIGSSMAMMSQGYKHFEVKSASNKYPSKQEKAKLKCSHCGGTGHLKEGCFKIIGYPDWYHEKRAKQQGDKPKGKANWAATNSNSGYSGPTYYTGSSTKQISQQGAIGSGQE